MKFWGAPPNPPEVLLGRGLLPAQETKTKRGPNFLKLKPNQRIPLTCLSHVWTGAYTHYYARRMYLHLNAECPFCAHKSEIRFHTWIHVITDDLATQYLMQLSSTARPALTKQFDQYGTLRGSHLYAFRDGPHNNTPTTIDWRSPPQNDKNLPEEIDIARVLLTLMAPSADAKTEPQADQPGSSKKENSK